MTAIAKQNKRAFLLAAIVECRACLEAAQSSIASYRKMGVPLSADDVATILQMRLDCLTVGAADLDFDPHEALAGRRPAGSRLGSDGSGKGNAK